MRQGVLVNGGVAVFVAAASRVLGGSVVLGLMLGILTLTAGLGVGAFRRRRVVVEVSAGVAIISNRGPADAVGVLGAAFAVFAGWVALNMVVNPDASSTPFSPASTSLYSPLLVLVLGVLLAATAALLVWGRARFSLKGVASSRAIIVCSLVGLLGIKLLIAWQLLRLPDFDAGIVLLTAYRAAGGSTAGYPFADATYSNFYYGIYPNNLALAQVLEGIFWLMQRIGIDGVSSAIAAAGVLNCIALTLVELLIFLVAKVFWGRRSATIALLVAVPFTTLSPYITTPYSDTFGMLFPIGLLYGWERLRRLRQFRRRLLLASGLGLAAALGIALKPTVVFAVAAILLVEAFRARRLLLKRPAVLLSSLLVLAVAVASGVGLTQVLTATANTSGLIQFNVYTWKGAVPLTHWMKIGATGTGGFNYPDLQSTLALPLEDRASAALEEYGRRVADFGPFGYASFLGQKALRDFADGSFFQGQEGGAGGAFLASGDFSRGFRDWYLRDGANHVLLASSWQALWLLMLICSCLPTARFVPRRQRRVIDTARIALLALLIFLMLFEGRSRYVYLYLPYFVLLVVGSLHVLRTVGVRFTPWTRLDGARVARPVAASMRPLPSGAADASTEGIHASHPEDGGLVFRRWHFRLPTRRRASQEYAEDAREVIAGGAGGPAGMSIRRARAFMREHP